MPTEEELRAYYSFLPNERLLGEGYILPGILGGNLTAKQDTPLGLLTETGGANYNVSEGTFDPYAEARLMGSGYDVKGAIDNYNRSLSGNIGNLSGSITETPYDTVKELSYNTPEYNAKVIQDALGETYQAGKNVNLFGIPGSINIFKNPWDRGILYQGGMEF